MKAFAGKTQHYQEGMDLRDYFAAKAMQAMVNEYDDFNMMSKYAYQIADAMMEARESK